MSGKVVSSVDPTPDLTQTVSRTDDESGEDLLVEAPRLIVAMVTKAPLTAAMRVALGEVDELVLGRGPRRAVVRAGLRAELALADQEMSRQHARLARVPGGWELHDLGSKNGTVVNGEATARVALVDGDVIEVGGTMLLFRDEAAGAAGAGVSGAGAGGFGALVDRDLAAEPASTPAAFRTVSLVMERHATDLARIAPSGVPVLVRGETGTGKELIARAVHERSGRRGAFVAVNCGALPRTLIESELFGHRRGAFSGAHGDREGLVRRADGGTLFLDEIAELPADSQVALLRVLQEGEVRPVGAEDAIAVDVRVVSATHQDLAGRIHAGAFRQDLYARLAGFEVALPPLRERREDVGALVAAILPRVCEAPAQVSFHRAAARALLAHGYPLNVRELEQALRAAVVLAEGGEVKLEHLPEAMREAPAATSALAAAALRPEDRALRERLIEVLRDSRGNVMAAARAMGKAPVQIRRWCRRLGIDVAAMRG